MAEVVEDKEPCSKKQKLNSSSPYFVRKRFKYNFFNVNCIDLAKNLLGTILVRKLEDGSLLKGTIVETECYLGSEDKASHSYNGRRTPRNEPMFMKSGTIYVYKTYGMYHCLNISSEGEGAAVLLRSIDPIIGLEHMNYARLTYHKKRKNESINISEITKKTLKPNELCNGPSKLCISFSITAETCNKLDLDNSEEIWIEEGQDEVTDDDIIVSTRIGIESAGSEWANKLLRFYIKDKKSVSIRDKKRENLKNITV